GAAARRGARGLRGVPPLRRARAAPGRGAPVAAHHALRRLDRAPLGRSGLQDRVPVVQHGPLLGRAHSRPARAGRADAGAPAPVAGIIPFALPPCRVHNGIGRFPARIPELPRAGATHTMQYALCQPHARRGRRRLIAPSWKPVLVTAIAAVLCACSQHVTLRDPTIPDPLVERIPLSVAVRYPEEFEHYVHKEKVIGKDEWTIDMGRANS